MSDLVNVEFVTLVWKSGPILPHQRSEGKAKQLLLSFVLRCRGRGNEKELGKMTRDKNKLFRVRLIFSWLYFNCFKSVWNWDRKAIWKRKQIIIWTVISAVLVGIKLIHNCEDKWDNVVNKWCKTTLTIYCLCGCISSRPTLVFAQMSSVCTSWYNEA